MGVCHSVFSCQHRVAGTALFGLESKASPARAKFRLDSRLNIAGLMTYDNDNGIRP